MSDDYVKCLNSLFCQRCIIEANGGMTLQSIHSSTLIVAQFPVKIPLCFVFFLELDVNRYEQSGLKELEIRVLINAPWGLTISDTRPEAPFKQISPEKAICNITIPFGVIDFFQAGEYAFEVFVNNKLLHTAILSLTEAQKP